MKGSEAIKRINKKYADEQELSEDTPARRSERRSAVAVQANM